MKKKETKGINGMAQAVRLARKLKCGLVMLQHDRWGLVDRADVPKASMLTWRTDDRGYIKAFSSAKNRPMIYLHRYLLGLNVDDGHDLEVDHKNGIKWDCRRCNIRTCTPSQNHANTPRRSHNRASQFKGVRINPRNCVGSYYARAVFNGKDLHLGTFKDEISAARAYDKWARKTFGQFAQINGV